MAKQKPPLTPESANAHERRRWLKYIETGKYDQSSNQWCALYGKDWPKCDTKCPDHGCILWNRWLTAEPKDKRKIAGELADRGR